MSPPKSVLLHIERIFSKFLWGVTEQHQRRVWRSWDRMSFPVRENGLGFRRLQDIFLAYSCKLWWKWRGNLGLWAHYVHQVSWSGSLAKHRLMSVDDIMRTNSRVLVRDGSAMDILLTVLQFIFRKFPIPCYCLYFIWIRTSIFDSCYHIHIP